ncbi:hypothetical protein COEREDRAFT_5372 [Coemansia reversa NRRL 1564]|uniref:Uncharacterized protein n=1 Tax=Coemansia reversa (strain ATCC 12441 / NRRL 1564) TaxID=763665 RepID=A0A2G5BKP3_COERN|nr:hypothetical protein COEREDRAFT_5372 [Coemansia reversa NRRL 1564]|eukprot:PIA19542.1 hypothetical protein COEREDRAFT_5372 [Coemansia reversa NRRL 1564]
MKLLGYTALGMQLLINVAGVHAFSPEPIQHVSIESSATASGKANEPSTVVNVAEHTCPECVVQLIMSAENNIPDGEEMFHQLANELARLVDEAAATLDRPLDKVYKDVEAFIRARGGGLRSQPHFDSRTWIGSQHSEGSWRFFDRMLKLLRQFISAYVTAVAENGLSPDTTSTSPVLTNTAETPDISVTTTSPPSSINTETLTADKKQATTNSLSSSRKNRSRSESNNTSNGDSDEDEYDEDEDDDSDDGK